jgi:hypothetical protein
MGANMENTSGFYKDDEGNLLFAPNGVTGPTYDLQPINHEAYTYPVEGWYWFDTEAEAREFFGLPPAPEPQPDNVPQEEGLLFLRNENET